MAMPSCFRLFTHWARRAAARAAWTAGRSRAMRTAMMAMTTSSSISVNPRTRERMRGNSPVNRSVEDGPETRTGPAREGDGGDPGQGTVVPPFLEGTEVDQAGPVHLAFPDREDVVDAESGALVDLEQGRVRARPLVEPDVDPGVGELAGQPGRGPL